MKKLFFCSMVIGGMLMSSCTDSIYDAPHTETVRKAYAQKFQEMLGGPVSRTEDFKMFDDFKLKVTLEEAADVRVYARVNAEVVYKLVGDFKNLSASTHELEVDAPESCKDFAVEVGNHVLCSETGEFDFTNVQSKSVASRTYLSSDNKPFTTTEETSEGSTTVTKIQKTFPIAEVAAFLTQVPENVGNYGNTNLAMDFKVMHKNDTKVRIYPVFWNAAYRHIFGIYTYNADGTIAEHYDIYKSKTGNTRSNLTQQQLDEEDLIVKYQPERWKQACNDQQPYHAYDLTGDNAPVEVRSHGFEVTFPDSFDGQTYGFYIKVFKKGNFDVSPDYIFYSDASLNTSDGGRSHAAYFQAAVGNSTRTFLGFEDELYNNSDKDLNDFVFIIEPEPIIIDKTPISWLLAAEDLGSTDDFDFNDVVVSLTRIAGQNKLTIKAEAAGGTLPVWLKYNGQILKPEGVDGDGEFHSWFGVPNLKDPDALYPMINTGRSAYHEGMTYTLTIDNNFTLNKFMDVERRADGSSLNNMGGFKIIVKHGEDKIETLESPREGVAPQMMCLPIDWKWPIERTPMIDAYPDFGEYGRGYLEDKTNAWVYKFIPGTVVE